MLKRIVGMLVLLLMLSGGAVAVAEEDESGEAVAEAWLEKLYAEAAEVREFRSFTHVMATTTDPESGTLFLNGYFVLVDREAERYALRVPGMYHVFLDGRILTMVIDGVEDQYLHIQLAEPVTFERVLEQVAPLAPSVPFLSVDFALMLDGDLQGLLPELQPSSLRPEHRRLVPQDADAMADAPLLLYGGDRAAFVAEPEASVVVAFEVPAAWLWQPQGEHRLMVVNKRENVPEEALRERTETLFEPDVEGREPADVQAMHSAVARQQVEEASRTLAARSDEAIQQMHDRITQVHEDAEQQLAELGDSAIDRYDRLYLQKLLRYARTIESAIAKELDAPF